MILLDTCALIFDALTPKRLTPATVSALDQGEREGNLACADISLWEIAMLIAKGRLDPGTDARAFCRLAVDARGVRCLTITPEIAVCSLPGVPEPSNHRITQYKRPETKAIVEAFFVK